MTKLNVAVEVSLEQASALYDMADPDLRLFQSEGFAPDLAYKIDLDDVIPSLGDEQVSLIRGVVDNHPEALQHLRRLPGVRKIYADPVIRPCASFSHMADTEIDHGFGTFGTIQELLYCFRRKPTRASATLWGRNLTGTGVVVAMLDTGVNTAYLQNLPTNHPITHQGYRLGAPALHKWGRPFVEGYGRPTLEITPGAAPNDHGTMMAFDVTMVAPEVYLLDIPILPTFSGPRPPDVSTPYFYPTLLTNAFAAYKNLLAFVKAHCPPHSLVVNNSWGVDPYEQGEPWEKEFLEPYADNPNHCFNLVVDRLATVVDVIFAAGNCGGGYSQGTVSSCQGRVGPNTIYGAHSLRRVLTVGAVQKDGLRMGYSSEGPGSLYLAKPDICTYTNFFGSRLNLDARDPARYGQFEANAVDFGTSAACAVTTGVVAALRTRYPTHHLLPHVLHQIIRETALKPAAKRGSKRQEGIYDPHLGHGIINVLGILKRLDDLVESGLLKPLAQTHQPGSFSG